jgi:hypothetical protein
MSSSGDECWKMAAECGHWAEESQDDATRQAFRQMAKAWAQLAFSEDFTRSDGKPASQSAQPVNTASPEVRPADARLRHRFS